jgi:hypothetical protein
VDREGQATQSTVRDQAEALIGRTVVNAQLGLGSILILDFAAVPVAPPDSYLRVESAWLLTRRDDALVGSADERADQTAALSSLVGTRVKTVDVGPQLQLVVALSDDSAVSVLPSYAASADYDNWVLRLPDGIVYTAGPGAQLVKGSADEP